MDMDTFARSFVDPAKVEAFKVEMRKQDGEMIQAFMSDPHLWVSPCYAYQQILAYRVVGKDQEIRPKIRV